MGPVRHPDADADGYRQEHEHDESDEEASHGRWHPKVAGRGIVDLRALP